MKSIGVDVGGTFTDLIYCDLDTGSLEINKVPTTPDDPSKGVMEGIHGLLAKVGRKPDEIDFVFHATTTATNAVLEHKGAEAGMITNEGFRDILHIGRHQRVEHYSIRQELPWQSRPLIKRRNRMVVGGRLRPPHGEEIEPLDEDAVRRGAQALKEAGVQSVAICFLFSYLNPAHEDRAREIVAEILPDAFVTTSSFVSPQFREFERFTTAALAAFIGPKVRTYITHLEASLKAAGISGDLRIMASNGGVATAGMVSEKPTLTLLSGLAAGVLAGAWLGEIARRRKLITFDIGGTSADIGIIVDGKLAETDSRSTSIAGFPLLSPMIDIHTIGAGGGSIAHIDRGGAFRVGPRSAGAAPGPAAYGRGGAEPTVTDANLVLGRLDAHDFLGGGMKLDVDAARRAVDGLATKLGLGLNETAEGILTVINANMANAIRSRTIQKGIDPRGFSLVAFGGGGPLQGADVAAMLEIPEVIVPPYPGITSAMGLLTTDFKYDAVRTAFEVSGAVDLAKLNRSLGQMEAGLVARFEADRIALDHVKFSRSGDLRYVGQGYELRVPLPEGEIAEANLPQVWEAFHAAHAGEYGHAFPANPIEIVNIRVSGVGLVPKLARPAAPPGGSLAKAKVRTSPCVFRVGGKLQSFETTFYHRRDLPVEEAFPGPAIILQTDSTTLVPPGASAEVDQTGNIIITLGAAQ
ncbi:N-methylhydantoinase A [Roseiarcus fermentans]|uniref:N-methylhydantoinase A n=1 Tax=Roseiarcus fermentans TaxID=1473586 RepID=A0A366FJ34_9HYPH|nr:hydantoinase/oxoprolinase family protein [Roseiarcus fermentans]RBP14000.1 N-methylhydantoinase A [Roseiarcus fermentans]